MLGLRLNVTLRVRWRTFVCRRAATCRSAPQSVEARRSTRYHASRVRSSMPAALHLQSPRPYDDTPGARRAGILVPLFSLASSRGWGIGEIGDIESMARWLAGRASACFSCCRSARCRPAKRRRIRR